MKLSTLTKTNIFIACILTLGFCLLSGIYYRSFYQSAIKNLEYSASESLAHLYSGLSHFFIQPISISRAMAKNDFLISYLSSETSYKQNNFSETITNYLRGYNKIYGFDGAFLSTIKNNALYTQDGFITYLTNQQLMHSWYEQSQAHNREYDINIDFDKTPSANNEISVFINHKITNTKKELLGITGLCVHLKSVMDFFLNFERETNKTVYIINEEGIVQVSSCDTALSNINIFDIFGNPPIKDLVQQVRSQWENDKIGYISYTNIATQNYITIKYIPDLSWYLVVENYMGDFYKQLRYDIIKSGILLFSIMMILMFFISRVISTFEKKIKNIIEDHLRYFHEATRYMYTGIYEIDITADRFAPESRLHQFRLSEINEELPYSESLKVLAQKAVLQPFQETFLKTFSRENLLKSFAEGCDHLSYDCRVLVDGEYQWLRYDVHIFAVESDKSIHMYLYAKNINDQIEKENKANRDDLTQCLTRGYTEQSITNKLLEHPGEPFAFLIIDIDNFKHANDTFGHAFGDQCIRTFAQTILSTFRKSDIIGRLGGDEFVIFIPYPDIVWLRKKAEELVQKLTRPCEDRNVCMMISGSIGIALSPADGEQFDTLYRHADAALYKAKAAGKKTFCFFHNPM
ncbi:MAG: sensor domain-containing diguanylate cyclase [Desulfovibrio sp.]|nr:sensor domain-containing diguanylate cyclase [Desulfovibrio sp.]